MSSSNFSMSFFSWNEVIFISIFGDSTKSLKFLINLSLSNIVPWFNISINKSFKKKSFFAFFCNSLYSINNFEFFNKS